MLIDAGSFHIVKGVEGADVCGQEFKIVVDWNEELWYSTVVRDKARGNVILINGLKVMLLDEASDLILEVANLDAVAFIAGIDGADETHNDGS